MHELIKMEKVKKYFKTVKLELDEMEELVQTTRSRSIASYEMLLINRRSANRENQIARFEEVLQACVCVESNGSGCIVDVDGEPMVLTNFHVAGKKGTIKFIMWNDGTYGAAKCTKLDKENDTAYMKIIYSKKDYIPRVSLEPYEEQEELIQIHNPYHWYNKNNKRLEYPDHFPFTCEKRLIEKRGDLFSHFATIDSSVFYGSSGSPFFSVDRNGILGGVVGIHREFDEENDDFIGVMINASTIPKFKF